MTLDWISHPEKPGPDTVQGNKRYCLTMRSKQLILGRLRARVSRPRRNRLREFWF